MKIFKISVLILIVLALLCLNKLEAKTVPSIIDIAIAEDLKISASVAATPTQRWQGLKGVEKMPKEYQGMLFVYQTEGMRHFTMEGTLMNLDLVFINENKVITIIFNDVEKYWEYVIGKKPVTISARAKYVLELPAGKAAEYNLKKGMELDFKLPREILDYFKIKVVDVTPLLITGDDDDNGPPPPPPNNEKPPPSAAAELEPVRDPIGELFKTPGVKTTKPALKPPKAKGVKSQKTKPPKPPKMIKFKKVKPKTIN